jgi:hypothetical protein
MTRHKLPATVIAIGSVSFLNDLASEMVTPFIPILIATVLGAGPVILGLVEGVADAAASFIKLWAGHYSDGKRGRRKKLMVWGYSLSNLARPLLGLVSSWGALLLLRSLDRAARREMLCWGTARVPVRMAMHMDSIARWITPVRWAAHCWR